MNLLAENVEEFSQLLIELDMTADQFFFCCLLASEQEDLNYNLPSKKEVVPRFYEYYNTVAVKKEVNPWSQETLEDLVERNYLIDKNKEGKYQYDQYEVTKKFISRVFDPIDSKKDKYEEFWNAYPSTYETQDGKKLNIKAVNFEQLFGVYKNALDIESHENILQSLKLAKNKDEVNCRPDKWLQSRSWEPYLDEIDQGVDPEQESRTTLV